MKVQTQEMICGIRCGTDLIEIDRVAQALRRPRFLEKLFTSREIEYFMSRGLRAETVAGRFAAKEAVSKLLGTGIRGFQWTDLEILADTLGKPVVTLYGSAQALADSLGIRDIELSVSHSRKEAVAFATALIWKTNDFKNQVNC